MKIKTFMQVVLFMCVGLGVLNAWLLHSEGLWGLIGSLVFCDVIAFCLVLCAGGFDDEI